MKTLLRFGAVIVLVCAFAVIPEFVAGQTVLPQTPSTQITTTAPVSSDTTISIGTIASEILTWFAVAFVPTLGGILALWWARLMKLSGIQVTDAMKSQLQGIIVNGLNSAAASNAERLRGKDSITVKNAIVADAIKYAQTHGAETIKALGLDPQSGEAVQAIKARIETAITDPATPTPAVITPAASQAAKV